MYVAVLAGTVDLAASVFMSSTRLSAMGKAALARIDAQEDIRADFADTVRMAQGVREGIGHYQSNAEQLVLALPPNPGQEDTRRYAVFGLLPEKQQFYRLVLVEEANGDLRPDRAKSYARHFEQIQFDYGDSDNGIGARMISLSLEPVRKKRGNRPPTIYRYCVAMRNFSGEGEIL